MSDSKVIRVDLETAERINELREGKETPGKVIKRLVDKESNDPTIALLNWIFDPCNDIDEWDTLIRLWHEGEFDSIRKEWGEDYDIPDEIFIGADPLFKPEV